MSASVRLAFACLCAMLSVLVSHDGEGERKEAEMGIVRPGKRNPNWRGGRSVASNGYVIVRVGVGHHLADVRGYAYEHRVVAEQKIGRRLLPGEQAHHLDGNKQNNAPENLEILTAAAHTAHHNPKSTVHGERLRFVPTKPAERLSPADIVTIREAYATGGVTLADLARRYGGDLQRFSRIIRGKCAAGTGGPISTSNHRKIARRNRETGRIEAPEAA